MLVLDETHNLHIAETSIGQTPYQTDSLQARSLVLSCRIWHNVQLILVSKFHQGLVSPSCSPSHHSRTLDLNTQPFIWQSCHLNTRPRRRMLLVRPDLVPLCIHPHIVLHVRQKDRCINDALQPRFSACRSFDNCLDVLQDCCCLLGDV